MVFPFALGGFSHKNSSVSFIFLLHEFIYLLLVIAITYLILHKENVEKFWRLLEYCEFTLTQLISNQSVKPQNLNLDSSSHIEMLDRVTVDDGRQMEIAPMDDDL